MEPLLKFGTLVAIQAMKEYILKYLSTLGLLHLAGYTFPDKGSPAIKKTVKKGDNVTLGGGGVTPSTFF